MLRHVLRHVLAARACAKARVAVHQYFWGSSSSALPHRCGLCITLITVHYISA